MQGTDASKTANYREELFKYLKDVNTVDNQDRGGSEVDTTLYDEGDEDEEFPEGKFLHKKDDDENDEDNEDLDDEDDEEFEEEEEESERPKSKKGKH